MKARRLEDVLKQWARRREPTASGADELLARVHRECAGDRYRDEVELSPNLALPGRLAWLAMGLALGGAAALWWSGPKGGHSNGAVHLAALTSQQVDARREIFGEMDTLFAGQLRWCAVSGDDVQMGVSELRAASPATDASAALVRLLVVRRAYGASEWESVWSADVITRDQEFVELKPNPGHVNRIALWVLANPDGTLVVESSVVLQGAVELDSHVASVVRPGVPVEIASARRADGDYRIYQVAQLLNGGGPT